MSADTIRSSSIDRVRAVLRDFGRDDAVTRFPESTRTAQEAAAAIGCSVAEICKTLIFKGARTGEPIIVVASGANRVDEAKITALAGEALVKADAAFVRERTGFAIGGVAPIGHAAGRRIFIDEDLLGYERLWAAAGSPFAVFPLTPDELVRYTAGTVAPVKL